MKNEKIKLTKFKNGCEERKRNRDREGGGVRTKAKEIRVRIHWNMNNEISP